jgi:cytochrome c biogenesis protein CcmG, thiol:disulfide interchange protein DsbE
MIVRRVVALGLTGLTVLVVAGCGGDDAGSTTTPTSTPTTTQTTTTDTPSITNTTAEPGDGPVLTIAPDLPEEFLDGAGPVAIVGTPLPAYPESSDETDAAVGMTAPVLIGETVDGEPMTVDASVDGPTWVIFLAHWCPHCNDEIPVINQLRDEGRIPDGVNVVAVSTAYNPGRPNWPPDEWLAEKDWTFPAINDGIDTVAGVYIAADAFGIGGFPFSMLVDGDGIVTTRWSGEREPDELVALLEQNLPPG